MVSDGASRPSNAARCRSSFNTSVWRCGARRAAELRSGERCSRRIRVAACTRRIVNVGVRRRLDVDGDGCGGSWLAAVGIASGYRDAIFRVPSTLTGDRRFCWNASLRHDPRIQRPRHATLRQDRRLEQHAGDDDRPESHGFFPVCPVGVQRRSCRWASASSNSNPSRNCVGVRQGN